MSEEQWYSSGTDGGPYRREEILVREWKPGDGLTCTWSNKSLKDPCGPPVAVTKTVVERDSFRSGGRVDRRITNRTVCIRHAAQHFLRSNEKAELDNSRLERQALEQLAAAHWDEWQSNLKALQAEAREQRLSMLPQPLRDRLLQLESDESSNA